ncbi:DUF3313 domain-containing protein [Pseudomonas sp. X10]
MKSRSLLTTLCIASLTLAGCASQYVEPDQYSGFLSDYSVLKPETSPSGAPVMRWVRPGVEAHRYTSIYLEPSQLHPQPQPTEKIPQTTLQGITQYYDQALRREFSKALPIASQPGPGTLVVRPAITAVSAQTKGLRPYEVIPIALVAAGVSTATGIRDQDTSIATEAAFIDGGNQQVVAEVLRKGAGADLDSADQVMQVQDVKAVLDVWASDMLRSYQMLHQK